MTDIRRAVMTDTAAHMLAHREGQAYADGYEQALLDALATLAPYKGSQPYASVQVLHSAASHSYRADQYFERVAKSTREAEAFLATAATLRSTEPVFKLRSHK